MNQPRRGSRQGIVVFLVSVVVVVALTGVPGFEDDAGSDPEQALRMQVWSFLFEDAELDHEQAVERLQSMGGRIAGPSFDILRGRDPAGPFRKEGRMPVDGFSDILLDALGGLPPREVAKAVLQRLDGESKAEEYVIALRVFGVTKMPGAIDHALDVLAELDARSLKRPTVRNSAVNAFTNVIANDPGALFTLRTEARGIDSKAWPVIIQSLGYELRADGLAVYESMLGAEPEIDALIIDQMTNLDVRDWASSYGEIVDILEEGFDSDDWKVLSSAAGAAGFFHTTEHAGALIRLARHENEIVAAAAMQSLRRMSGRSFSVAERWASWYEQEQAWYETHFRRLAANFKRTNKVEIIEALQVFGGHRFYRDDVAVAATEALWFHDTNVAKLVIKFVGGLGSPFVLPDLVAVLDSSKGEVRVEAQRVLAAMTGQDWGEDPEAWSDWLNE